MALTVEPTGLTDPMHRPGGADEHWSTDNVGEAMPGVLSPLGASVWWSGANNMLGRIAYGLGVFDKTERDSDHCWFRIFYGRGALQVEYLARVGDRMPGTSGEEAVKSIFGRAPDDITWNPTRARYPFVLAKLPVVFARSPARIRAVSKETDTWWRTQVPRLKQLSHQEAIATFNEAYTRFDTALTLQSIGLLGCIQPIYDTLEKVVAKAGVGDIGVLSGSGGAEMAIVSDMWSASRGRIAVADVVASHGFHGPREGEISSVVWREDPSPLARLIGEYSQQDESSSPVARDAENRRRRAAMQCEVAAAFPSSQRPAVKLALRLAAERIPLRGVAKRAFLQSLDIGRGAARRAGEHLALEGRLDDPEDAFYLVPEELTGRLPVNVREIVAFRRERRAEYQQMRIQSSWQGLPAVLAAVDGTPSAGACINGLGVSAGIVEGTVRVVTDPAFAEVEPGEVLVSSTTDPSWCSIMMISAALVVDIGSALSHAAVVARELGVPCVVNTRTGSAELRTGDRVRVDGAAGTVELLERAG